MTGPVVTGERRRTSLRDGDGWVFWNPDSGEEYSPDHPRESGSCPDAEHVRRSTGQEDVLWQGMQGQFQARRTAEARAAILAGQVAVLRAMLKAVEWASKRGDGPSCPSCNGVPWQASVFPMIDHGHTPDCRLAAVLAATDPATASAEPSHLRAAEAQTKSDVRAALDILALEQGRRGRGLPTGSINLTTPQLLALGSFVAKRIGRDPNPSEIGADVDRDAVLEDAAQVVDRMPKWRVVFGRYYDTAEGHSFQEHRPSTFADAAEAIRARKSTNRSPDDEFSSNTNQGDI